MTEPSRALGAVGACAAVVAALGLAVAATSPAAAVVPATGSTGRLAAAVTTSTTAPTPTPSSTARPATPPVAARAVPKHSGTGRRIVYSEKAPQHVWLIDGKGRVVRDFPVSGRTNWPRTGTYRVFSKSPRSFSTAYAVSFRWMVRFAHGRNASIGFHTIPRYPSGRMTHRLDELGRPVGRGGCPHSADADARFLYRWASIGTNVVVVR